MFLARAMSSADSVVGLAAAGMGMGAGAGAGFFGGNKAMVATLTGQADGEGPIHRLFSCFD